MPGFKASKDRQTLFLGTKIAGDFTLKPMLVYHSKNLRVLQNYAKFTLPVLYKWKSKAWVTAHLFTRWLTDAFKSAVETYSLLRKKDSFQNITAQ